MAGCVRVNKLNAFYFIWWEFQSISTGFFPNKNQTAAVYPSDQKRFQNTVTNHYRNKILLKPINYPFNVFLNSEFFRENKNILSINCYLFLYCVFHTRVKTCMGFYLLLLVRYKQIKKIFNYLFLQYSQWVILIKLLNFLVNLSLSTFQ